MRQRRAGFQATRILRRPAKLCAKREPGPKQRFPKANSLALMTQLPRKVSLAVTNTGLVTTLGTLSCPGKDGICAFQKLRTKHLSRKLMSGMQKVAQSKTLPFWLNSSISQKRAGHASEQRSQWIGPDVLQKLILTELRVTHWEVERPQPGIVTAAMRRFQVHKLQKTFGTARTAARILSISALYRLTKRIPGSQCRRLVRRNERTRRYGLWNPG